MNRSTAALDLAPFEQRVTECLGMRCDEAGRTRLREAVQRRMRDTQTGDPARYLAMLGMPDQPSPELLALAQELTIGETYFFREPDHFKALRVDVLPALAEARAHSRRLRVLSAGCSGGEEAYTLAILLYEQMPQLQSWDVEIIGIDVNAAFLAKAARGEYTQWSLRSLDALQAARYFRHVGDRYQLREEIRRRARFEQHNLLDPDPSFWRPERFDIIFCRNVLIYFTVEAMSAIVERFRSSLALDGYLFLGHAETLRGLSRSYHLCQSQDTFYYQRRETEVEVPTLAEALWATPDFDAPTPTPPAPVPQGDLFADSSWFDEVQRTNERIAALTSGHPPPAFPLTPPAQAATPFVAAAPAEDRMSRARELFRSERYAQTIELLRSTPESGRDSGSGILLAAALMHSNQLGEAETLCRQLLAVDELNPEAAYLQAVCREQAGDLPGASRQAQAASYLDPDFAMPHLLLGRLALRAGQKPQARREFNQALNLFIHESSTRILLFGGGFSRETLTHLCRNELAAAER